MFVVRLVWNHLHKLEMYFSASFLGFGMQNCLSDMKAYLKEAKAQHVELLYCKV